MLFFQRKHFANQNSNRRPKSRIILLQFLHHKPVTLISTPSFFNNLMSNHFVKVNLYGTKHDFCCLCFSRKLFGSLIWFFKKRVLASKAQTHHFDCISPSSFLHFNRGKIIDWKGLQQTFGASVSLTIRFDQDVFGVKRFKAAYIINKPAAYS